ncbi:RHS repeat-associated core domain-containing protein [Chryseobacterium sp. JJR-5R]|uniref:RHS repeat domain-containing protein n=1 Tax=Chryseobacterium sp. JJR-5R TaxID=3093923 RepID=UPI002A766640|nr:RHS repeat-associated core domain-containing protein [Chryseobacterium sp. JJR-5R]WPO81968.1 RHS repeat-associated core domain-containing protein [Chryseobacterium sp. JJR-5R]
MYIYKYVDHLGNVRLSYFNNGNSTEVLEENNYYPFGLKHEGYNSLAGNPSYQYKYSGKELQTESGMYDYGARMYMPDIARWNAIDPKSQYTHELYSYVWNNPISYNDPIGMFGEMFAFPINDGTKDGQVWEDTDGMFYWDAKRGLWRDFKDGSSVITQVSILVQSKNSSPGTVAAAATAGFANAKNPAGWAFLAAIGIYVIYRLATQPKIEWYTPLPEHTTIADPGVGMRNLKTEDAAEEDSDANDVEVPEEGKMRKNRIPDKGELNTVETNDPGTISKKYGPEMFKKNLIKDMVKTILKMNRMTIFMIINQILIILLEEERDNQEDRLKKEN